MPRHGPPAGRSATIAVHLTPAEADKVRAHAAAEDRSASQVVRRMIMRCLADNENTAPVRAPRSKTRAGVRDDSA
jgi:hypothetical protein